MIDRGRTARLRATVGPVEAAPMQDKTILTSQFLTSSDQRQFTPWRPKQPLPTATYQIAALPCSATGLQQVDPVPSCDLLAATSLPHDTRSRIPNA
jgi:hypothetical protein